MSVQAAQRASGAEQPVLWLGLAGFPPAERKALEASIARASGVARWRTCPFGDADGWWVNGPKCSVIDGDRLKVAPGLPTEHTLRLQLSEINRPLGFAQPLAPSNLEVLCVFDATSEESVRGALAQFEKWLMPVRTRFVLGALLMQRDSEQRRGTFHLSYRGTLLTVLDFEQGTAAVSPRAHPPDLWEATWERRPAGAGTTPKGFASCTITQLAWGYVRRTDRDMLPQRYRTEMIYYRHVPRVPMRWLRDSQLLLLREVSAEPGTLQSLQDRTSLPAEQIAHDLACLYYAGSVTTTPEAAGQGSGDSMNSYGLWPESRSVDDLRSRADLTAPALLEPRARRLPEPDLSLDAAAAPSAQGEGAQQPFVDAAEGAVAHTDDVVPRPRRR